MCLTSICAADFCFCFLNLSPCIILGTVASCHHGDLNLSIKQAKLNLYGVECQKAMFPLWIYFLYLCGDYCHKKIILLTKKVKQIAQGHTFSGWFHPGGFLSQTAEGSML